MKKFIIYSNFDMDNEMFIEDERDNFSFCDEGFNGYVIAFAQIGMWNGIREGAKIINTIEGVLYSSCDYCEWYLDSYNLRFRGTHHDGQNTILYRYVDTKEQAQNILNRIVEKGMSEEQFRKATKSLRKYVAKVYGV